ncbi:hypothetical protein ACH5RR_033961 [Cinchona calisaya]|uniref:Uncharacterized protein n=1 Tax=Cinchona calisaya TaxID=153742 RepID=A0ABD2YD34_9GENT
MEKSDAYKNGLGSSKKWDGGGPRGPRSGPYDRGPHGPPHGLDNVRGIDNTKFFFFDILLSCERNDFGCSTLRCLFMTLFLVLQEDAFVLTPDVDDDIVSLVALLTFLLYLRLMAASFLVTFGELAVVQQN